ncbi:MAG: response regulator [Bacteroidota bacterium]
MSKLYIPEILLADDDNDDCMFFKDALEELQAPTNLTTVSDGEQLMDYLEKVKYIPDVLFLDLNMPRKNGYECLKEIKQNYRLKNMPVVVISTSFEPGIVELLQEQGAQHYICKPATYYELVKVTHQAVTLIIQSQNTDQPTTADFVISPRILVQ